LWKILDAGSASNPASISRTISHRQAVVGYATATCDHSPIDTG
jgi:hypothetical protein